MSHVPYEITVRTTDDESLSFTMPFALADDSAFPFSEYGIEYEVRAEGCDRPAFSLSSSTTGVTVTAPYVSFALPFGSLRPGRYSHGCRIRHVTTGDVIQVFDGPVIVAEGGF